MNAVSLIKHQHKDTWQERIFWLYKSVTGGESMTSFNLYTSLYRTHTLSKHRQQKMYVHVIEACSHWCCLWNYKDCSTALTKSFHYCTLHIVHNTELFQIVWNCINNLIFIRLPEVTWTIKYYFYVLWLLLIESLV